MESIQLAQMLADLSDLNAAVCFVDADSLAALRVQAWASVSHASFYLTPCHSRRRKQR
jgi:hypothetical protein